MTRNIKKIFLSICILAMFTGVSTAQSLKAWLELKTPGNNANTYRLDVEKSGSGIVYSSKDELPVEIKANVQENEEEQTYSITITALDDVYFNFKQSVQAGSFAHEDCQFLMPGFWYRRNLRSPKEAPSFHTSDSWLVREDRLSTPLTGVYNEKSGEYYTVLRSSKIEKAAYSAIHAGEVILSSPSDLGFTGFENIDGKTWLSFGFPYQENPKTYIRKLTLAPSVTAFEKLEKGQNKTLSWKINKGKASNFSDFVSDVWTYSYDSFKPQAVQLDYNYDFVKQTLSNFFTEGYTEKKDLNYYSGIHLLTYDCSNNGGAEIGFIGRVLLNAYFALEYAEEKGLETMKENANKIFDSYLKNGFTSTGYFREFVHFDHNEETEVYSIRRQSEGIYAIMHYLKYENSKGRKHLEWEARMKTLLSNFMAIQNEDGSFPRKFDKDGNVIDASGGSTPSATLPLVMASEYFKNKTYLASAKKTGNYLESEIISKSDYFSSTLDANCEDKEASLYASTAMYYLALATKGKVQEKYTDLAKKATYFALSWYYTWDVPFAQGQMLGDIGLKSRGWGNVSVENNHIDVFIFELVDVLTWLDKTTDEPRFTAFADVIKTSMMQLLPFEGHMCGIERVGYYPEVVQHTNWDYGKNGKGFYNNYFAPGWTVASLWELLSTGSAEKFMKK
ncbi:hypothetical protein [Plebeiibacterium sediminum]|uniref:Glycosyl hydrolase family 63 C-terminal domain-containing protein n=1 Tax=Plebeiibacterium sediminum TaxID=2992112 RepID=A0AAE3SHA6_9BACT|nr:hypothetical protein [Plebeiobacterium sediminum]MCW3788028.1 hypothetical protein [Plebeiobacterium sediminum]